MSERHSNLGTEFLLLAALKMGSHEAFMKIFRLYYKGLVNFCGQFIGNLAVCEDIVQDVFVRLWEERASIEIRRSLRSYLTILVQNRALDELRRAKVKDRYVSAVEMRLLDLTPEDHLFFTDLSEALEKAILELPDNERDTLRLSIVRRLTYPQIAESLGVSVRTVESRISRALKAIRRKLQAYRSLLISIGLIVNATKHIL